MSGRMPTNALVLNISDLGLLELYQLNIEYHAMMLNELIISGAEKKFHSFINEVTSRYDMATR